MMDYNFFSWAQAGFWLCVGTVLGYIIGASLGKQSGRAEMLDAWAADAERRFLEKLEQRMKDTDPKT